MNPEVCYGWSLVFWAGMFAFILRWARFPRRVVADSTGIGLIPLFGKTLIPFADIEQLSVVKRLGRALIAWYEIGMEQYSALSIQRRGKKEQFVAMDTADAEAIESIYRNFAPPEDIIRQARARIAWDPVPELVALQHDVERFLLDLRRNLILKDIAAAVIFCLTVMVTINALGDRNLRNEIYSPETKAFTGVLIGALVLSGYLIIFAYCYGMYIGNRVDVFRWRFDGLRGRLLASGRPPLRFDQRINDLMNKSTAQLLRMGLAGLLMVGVMFLGIGVSGWTKNHAMYNVEIVIYGITALIIGTGGYYFYRSMPK